MYFDEKNLNPINEKTINKNAVAKIKEYWLIRLYKLLSLVITTILVYISENFVSINPSVNIPNLRTSLRIN